MCSIDDDDFVESNEGIPMSVYFCIWKMLLYKQKKRYRTIEYEIMN